MRQQINVRGVMFIRAAQQTQCGMAFRKERVGFSFAEIKVFKQAICESPRVQSRGPIAIVVELVSCWVECKGKYFCLENVTEERDRINVVPTWKQAVCFAAFLLEPNERFVNALD